MLHHLAEFILWNLFYTVMEEETFIYFEQER